LDTTETKYITFRKVRSTRKTEVWEVISNKHKVRLGVIKWYGAWFRYAFMPEPNTLFDARCLGEIGRVLNALMKERGQ
jgi:hypothetical protein